MKLPFELLFWILALLGIAGIDVGSDASHFSICPLDQLGISWCPGCGLGRSMKLLLVGEFRASWAMHPLGGFAFLVIGHRIVELILNIKRTKHYGKRIKASS
ncbi:DUF2752 domain-containing protein [Pleomorphovibrio marinus]|uniref:DUF2752 domain-containing protein n=1 Tax=Pleomorphovibrio marinus TaxID=2164132 RepID=UPI000E09F873|nr:DUF2752 domain-containing protein [Pleomorphovibrio marinus]